MPKPRKRVKPARPNASPERSRTRCEADLDPALLETLRALPKAERQEIGELIRAVCDSFGDVHAHRGLGMRDLGHGFYECRKGLKQRLIFCMRKGCSISTRSAITTR